MPVFPSSLNASRRFRKFNSLQQAESGVDFRLAGKAGWGPIVLQRLATTALGPLVALNLAHKKPIQKNKNSPQPNSGRRTRKFLIMCVV